VESILVNGSPFTWKKRIYTHLIYERLDRTIAMKDWSLVYPDAFEVHGNFTCSDHCPIIMSSDSIKKNKKLSHFVFKTSGATTNSSMI